MPDYLGRDQKIQLILNFFKMKKFAYILVLVFALGILLTSCNKKANCPAYRGQVDQEQVENPQA